MIFQEEKERRQEAVQTAIAINSTSAGSVTEETMCLAQKWVEGEMVWIV